MFKCLLTSVWSLQDLLRDPRIDTSSSLVELDSLCSINNASFIRVVQCDSNMMTPILIGNSLKINSTPSVRGLFVVVFTRRGAFPRNEEAFRRRLVDVTRAFKAKRGHTVCRTLHYQRISCLWTTTFHTRKYQLSIESI